jgi:hypothetical protein
MFPRPSSAFAAAATLAFSLAAIAAFFTAAPPARAELKWATQEFEGSLAPGQESLATRFTFKNTGPAPVRITEVRVSCGCTTGKPDRELYKPGQSGALDVTFAAEGAVGLREQILFIATDEPGREPYPLTLKINIAEWLTLTPRFFQWTLGSPATPQSAQLTLDPKAGARILRATSSDPAFVANLLPASAPDSTSARVEITPAATDLPARAIISVVVLLPSGEELTRTIHVRVR